MRTLARVMVVIALSVLGTPVRALQSGPTDRAVSDTHPQWLPYTSALVSGTTVSNFFTDSSHFFVDARGHLRGLGFPQTPVPSVQILSDCPHERTSTGLGGPVYPLGDVPQNARFLLGPDGVVHATWEVETTIIDGLGQSAHSSHVAYKKLTAGAWSALQVLTPQLPWEHRRVSDMKVGSDGRLHVLFSVTLYQSAPGTHWPMEMHLAYYATGGSYDRIEGTQPAQPSSANPGSFDGKLELLDNNRMRLIWSTFFTDGRPSGTQYEIAPLGGPVTGTQLFNYPGSNGNWGRQWWAWGNATDSAGDDHIVYLSDPVVPDSPFIVHLVNNQIVEQIPTVPSAATPPVGFGAFCANPIIGFDSRGLTYVLFRSAHYLKNSSGWQSAQTPSFSAASPVPVASGSYVSGGGRVVFGRNDEMWMIAGSNPAIFTRSLSHGIGVRDPLAHASVMPGGMTNLVSGNFTYSLSLFSAQGVGLCQGISLNYNSLDNRFGLIAPGWRLNYEMSLTDHGNSHGGPSVRVISVTMPDGRPVVFRHDATYPFQFGQVVVAYDEYGFSGRIILPTSPLDHYLLLARDGTRYSFNQQNGNLRFVQDPSGHGVELIYDAAGYLSQVKDQWMYGGPGRTSQINYADAPEAGYPKRISSIVDPGGSSYVFQYDGWNLGGIVFAGVSPSPTYGFTTTTQTVNGIPIERLMQVTRPRGGAWSLSYLPDGRVSGAGGPGASMTITYDESVPPAQSRKTTVHDYRGHPTEFLLEPRSALTLQINDSAALASQAGIFPVVRTFDAKGRLTDVQDRWGQVTHYDYFTSTANPWISDLLSAVHKPNPNVAGLQLVAEYQWDMTSGAVNRLSSATTWATPTLGMAPVPRTTTFSYGIVPHVPSVISYPNVTRPDGAEQTGVTRVMTYGGSRLQLSQITDEEGRVTDFLQFDPVTGLPTQVQPQPGTQPTLMVYDVMGNVTSRTLPRGVNGNEVPGAAETVYDGLHRPQTFTDPLGKITQYQYDLDSNLTQVTPPAGGVRTFTFDARGYPDGGSDPDGTWSQVCDPMGNVTSSTDRRGAVASFQYDFAGRLTQSTLPGGSSGAGGGGPATSVTQYAYDLFNAGTYSSTVTRVGTANRVTTTFYDRRGRAKAVLEPDGFTRQDTIYDEQDQAVAQHAVYDSVVQSCSVYFRDARGRVDHQRTQDMPYGTGPENQADTYTLFDKSGFVVQQVDPLGNVAQTFNLAHKTSYVPDARGRLFRVIDGLGNIVREILYGEDDLVSSERVPDPATKTGTLVTALSKTYTARKELKQTMDRDGNPTSYQYGILQGQLTQSTDPLGRITKMIYDTNHQRAIERIESMGTVDEDRTQYQWTNGLMTETRVFNPETGLVNAAHKRFYDMAGRLERVEAPNVSPEVYSYNSFGELSQVTMGSKQVTHGYNVLGQPSTTIWSGAVSATITRAYNEVGQLTSQSDGYTSVGRVYDNWRGALVTETHSIGGAAWKVQTYDTDLTGTVRGLIDGEGQSHGWNTDENGRIKEVLYGSSVVKRTFYTPGGMVDHDRLQSATGLEVGRTTYRYDGLGRRTRATTVSTQTATIASDLSWQYDTAGQITAANSEHLGAGFGMTYDGKGRLKSHTTAGNAGGLQPPPYTNQYGPAALGNESAPSTPDVSGRSKTILAVPARVVSVTYGPGGNRLTQTIDGVTTTYTYNAAQQLVSETSTQRNVSHQYDEWGNEAQRVTTVSGQPTMTETYGYNYLNMLSAYSNSQTGALWQYQPWVTGERYSKKNMVSGVSELYAVRAGDVVADYSKTAAGAPSLQNTYVQGLGMDDKSMRVAAGSSARRYYLGDSVGTVGTTLDEAGQVAEQRVRDAWGVPIEGASAERYGFAQREHDGETGLIYVRHRMYDPKLGRFTQGDPLLENRASQHYSYASNNPTKYTDPTGETIALPEGARKGFTALLNKNGITEFGSSPAEGGLIGFSAQKEKPPAKYTFDAEVLWRMLISPRVFTFGTLQELEREMSTRLNVVIAAKGAQFGFGTVTQGPPGWAGDSSGFTGSPYDAIMGWYVDKGCKDFTVGCKDGTMIVFQQAAIMSLDTQADYEKLMKGTASELSAMDTVVMKSTKDVSTTSTEPDDWVPGDRGHIKNMSTRRLPGREGENIIYLGGSFRTGEDFYKNSKHFWGLWDRGGTTDTLEGWMGTVRRWNEVDPRLQDYRNTLNTKLFLIPK